MDEVKWGSTNRGTRECGAGFLFGCLSLLLTSSIHLQVELAVAFLRYSSRARPHPALITLRSGLPRELADCTLLAAFIQRKKGAEDSEVDAASSFLTSLTIHAAKLTVPKSARALLSGFASAAS